MQNYCKVYQCRFKHSHTTRGHKCGTCSNYGHGQYECNSQTRIENLKPHWNEVIDENERCTFSNCINKYYHTSIAHPCNICMTLGHCANTCPINNNNNETKTLNCPICRISNTIKIQQTKIRGLEETCCICMDKKVEIFLQECGHVCICYDCFIDM